MKTAKQKLIDFLIVFSVILAVLCSCSSSNYGRLQSNPEATELFKPNQILPGYKYYSRGPVGQPIAVVAIKDKYKFPLELWVEIDPHTNSRRDSDLETMVHRVSLQGIGSTVNPWGFTIYDQNGNDIGYWYSSIRTADVQVNENNEIVRLFPGREVTAGAQPQTSSSE